MFQFQSEGVALPDLDFAAVGRWLTGVAVDYGKRIGNISYMFCDDEEILRVNRQFLGHDYFTDIITFDYSIGNKIGGDIYISLDTVRSNAEKLGELFHVELYRVLVHGVLHLCGLKDKSPEERAVMEEAENNALSKLNL